MSRSSSRQFRSPHLRASSFVHFFSFFSDPAFPARAGRAALAVALLAGAAGAHAQPRMTEGPEAERFTCGGIGSDESASMRAAMKSHPLSLLFARADGAYVAEVGVTIRNAKGATALRLNADGPICLIDLPAGRYNIEATSEGRTQRRDVTLGGTPTTADFRF